MAVLRLLAAVRVCLFAAPCHDAHVMGARGAFPYFNPLCPFGSGALADAIGKEPTRATCAHPPTHAWLTLRRMPCSRPRVCRARSTPTSLLGHFPFALSSPQLGRFSLI